MDHFLILLPIMLGIGSFVMITIIVAIAARAKQRRAEIYADVQTKLIDKFSSAPELLTFLKTEEGRKFLGEIERAPKLGARDRIVRGMGKSVVIGLLFSSLLSLKLSRSWGLMEEQEPTQPNV